jgi:arylsulfatase A-like enzyme
MASSKLKPLAWAILCAVGASVTPNFVILLADDMGWGDISLRGSPASTPNLDAMAQGEHSVYFHRFYSGAAVCSPTRASILTGRTPSRDCIYSVEKLAISTYEASIAQYAKVAGYTTGFFGKWHLGSLTNATTPDCYSSGGATCLPGYVAEPNSLCCDGRDAYIDVVTPLELGFDSVVATPQVGATSTLNCGCLETVPGAGQGCNLGHYNGTGPVPDVTHLECNQYFYSTANGNQTELESYQQVSPVDDQEFLVDQFEAFATAAVKAGTPFLAQISFHSVHIPYVAPPAFRAMYANLSENEQDYYGTLTSLDAQVGRIRALLQTLGIYENTWLSFAADNGPEDDNMTGHDTAPFPNPGSTDGLRGRKRDLTEGGIRVPGIVEYPALISSNIVEMKYPAVTMDYLPTFMDLIQAPSLRPSWPLDGHSLVGYLNGSEVNRTAPIGFYSDFIYGIANPNSTKCPNYAASDDFLSLPANFTSVGSQPQIAWVSGDYKMWGCQDKHDQVWHFFLYNIVADPAETTDLSPTMPTFMNHLFAEFLVWQQSVRNSQVTESMCPPNTTNNRVRM